ncbi:unnamed protein product [Clonostachys byssicola]|uniref:2-iminobutanoate/2-iminopropanoate deaminase n=1 Tax=Clonostachys byssicola TaxID=160290 RepID=A0A9N9Y4Q9_9HYPO|nr:unnamed protein product [Clonostachys byssicola]
MSSRRAVYTSKAPKPLGGLLSQAIVANGFVFTSGVIASDPETGHMIGEGDIQAQFHQCVKTLGAILDQAGSSLGDVVDVTLMVADSSQFASMNEAYKGYWGDIKPARMTIFCTELPPKSLVELKCVAVVTKSKM